MKLALVCRPFSFHGGVETATAGLLRALIDRGYAIDLVSTRRQPDVPGARVRRLPTARHPSLFRTLSFALAARRAVMAGGYDLVQSHERVLLQDVYRAGEGTHRGYLAAMGRDRRGLGLQHRLVCALEARIFRLRTARHVVAISRRDRDEIARLYGTPADSVTLIYNGVDLARFHPDARARLRPAARGALGLSEGDWVALFVGSGFARKGLDIVLGGLARMSDARARLVVAGKGDAAPFRRQAAALGVGERVTWVGPRRDVEALYAAADVVAVPARYEPFGNVHLEALASGVPVVTSALAGGSEVVRSGENGWIARELTAMAVAEGLDAMRDADRARVTAAARQSAEPFTYEAQAGGYGDLHRRLAGGASRKPPESH